MATDSFCFEKRSISREQIEGEAFKSFSDLLHRTGGIQSSCKRRAAKKLSTENEYLIDLGKAQKEEREKNTFIKTPCPIVKRGRWGWRKGYFVCEKERPKRNCRENTVDDESSDRGMELVFAVLLHRRVFRFTKELMLRVVKRTILHRCVFSLFICLFFLSKEQALKMQMDDNADKTFS
ncbi:hypothetical protein CEXT_169901 [Caerostris extrusa]|uniref:Uncharacterized protein n=1 Tax=Caerostris extrusa TaxID=172846 RepID=A0AAV4ULN1_CAEEX|nr:hypothetical protein CEXT_169901 [Caerostris extrusa]